MVREPKIEIVDLLRNHFVNPNTNVPSQGVFPDEPRKDLKWDSYPRIQVADTDSIEEYVGMGGDDMEVHYSGQIRIFVKQTTDKDQLLKIGDEVYNDHKLIDYVAKEVRKILSQNILNDCTIQNYKKLGETEPLLDVGKGRYVKFINFRIDYIEDYEES